MPEALSPAQKFRVRAALAEGGMNFAMSRAEALDLAQAWETAERADRAEEFYLAELQRAREMHADILEKSGALMEAGERLRRRFLLAVTISWSAGFFVGALIVGLTL